MKSISLDKDAQLGEFGYSREDRKIRSLGWDALENVMNKIVKDEKYAALEEAMDPIWSVEGQEPLSLLVRAGRLPESVLYHKVELPNGDIYNMIAPMELVINFKRKLTLSEESDGANIMRQSGRKPICCLVLQAAIFQKTKRRN